MVHLDKTPTTTKLYITVPRSGVMKGGDMFEFHGFSDASKVTVCAAIYVIGCLLSNLESLQRKLVFQDWNLLLR